MKEEKELMTKSILETAESASVYAEARLEEVISKHRKQKIKLIKITGMMIIVSVILVFATRSWFTMSKEVEGTKSVAVSLGIQGTTFGSRSIIKLDDNYTSLGTADKPFWGTITIADGSTETFYCEKPLFGNVEQSSSIVDETSNGKTIKFVRSLSYDTGSKPQLLSLVLADKIVNTQSTSSSNPFTVNCELVYEDDGSNIAEQHTKGLVGVIDTGAYADITLKYDAPQINIKSSESGNEYIGLFCDVMESSSYLKATFSNTSEVSYNIESKQESAGGIVGKMNSNSVLLINGTGFANITQNVKAAKYAGGIVGYAEDAYIGVESTFPSSLTSMSLGDNIKSALTTLEGGTNGGNGYLAGYYKNTLNGRTVNLGTLEPTQNLFSTSKNISGGLFGLLENVPDTTAEGFAGGSFTIDGNSGTISSSGAGTCRMMVSASGENSGGLIGNRDTALVYSMGTGDNSTWTLRRPTASIAKDDIGTWGEVVRGAAGAVISETNLSSQHKVEIPAVTVSSSGVSVTSLSDFVTLALNLQHNTYDTSEALTVSGTQANTLLGTNISLGADIVLTNTGGRYI